METVTVEYADWPKEGKYLGKLGTSHLPEELVAQPVTIAIWCGTNKDDLREGAYSYSVVIGERENPTLTEQEREYIQALLEFTKQSI